MLSSLQRISWIFFTKRGLLYTLTMLETGGHASLAVTFLPVTLYLL